MRYLQIPVRSLKYIVAACSVLCGGSCTTSLRSKLVLDVDPSKPWVEGLVYELPVSDLDFEMPFTIYKKSITQTRTAMAPDAPKTEEYTKRVVVQYFAIADAAQWKVTTRTSGSAQLRLAIDFDSMKRAGVQQDFDANKVALSGDGFLSQASFQAEDRSAAIALNVVNAVANIAGIATVGVPLGTGSKGAAALAMDYTPWKDNGETAFKRVGPVVLRTSRSAEELLSGNGEIDHIKDMISQSPEMKQFADAGENIPPQNFSGVSGAPSFYVGLKSIAVSLNAPKPVNVAEVKRIIHEMGNEDVKQVKSGKVPTPPVSAEYVDGIVSRYKGAATLAMRVGSLEKEPPAKTSFNGKAGDILFAGNVRIVEAGGVQRFKLNGRKFTDAKSAIGFDANGSPNSLQAGGGSSAEGASAAAASVTKQIGDSYSQYETKLAAEKTQAQAQITAALTKMDSRAALQKTVADAEYAIRSAQLGLDAAKIDEASAAAALQKLKEGDAGYDEAKIKYLKAQQAVAAAEQAVTDAKLQKSAAQQKLDFGN